MRHHRIHQLGRGFGRAGAHQLGQAAKFSTSWVVMTLPERSTTATLAVAAICQSAKGRFSTTVTEIASG